jgi:hypothetical protein
MKKFLALYVICIYVVPISVFVTLARLVSQEEPQLLSLIVPFIIMFLICLLALISIIGAIRAAVRNEGLSFKAVMLYKLCLIPFYVVNFLCWLMASMVFHIMLVVWPLIPFIIVYTYLTVVGTSVHNVARLIILRRQQSITTKQCALHCIWQFFFVIDVIDSIYLVIKNKRWNS